MKKEKKTEKFHKRIWKCKKADLCLGVLFAMTLFLGMFWFSDEKIKAYFVDFNGLVSRIMGQRTLNETVLLENGHLIEPEAQLPGEYIGQNVEKLEEFERYADSIGCELLYISVPAKNLLHEETLPAGVTDYALENANNFWTYLDETEIKYIDVRDILEQQEEPALNYYYFSDHHWKASFGLEMASYLADYLNANMQISCDADMLESSHFETIMYDSWHLGSHGRRVGRFFGPGADDFELIYPLYETSFLDYTTGQEGNFREVVLGARGLDERNYYWGFVYDAVYGKMMNRHIDNLSNDEGPRVYVVSDSMGNVVFPYLALVCDEVYWGNMDEETVRNFAPDVIIVMRWSRTLL